LKSDREAERLPSGKYEVNRIVPAVAMNAYNGLRVPGQRATAEAGRKKFKRERLGKVIRDIICVAGKLVRHAGQLVLKVYEQPVQFPGEKREPIPVNEHHSKREDNEYIRKGTCSVFMFVEPLGEGGMSQRQRNGRGRIGRGK
jgi:hypothetical protein